VSYHINSIVKSLYKRLVLYTGERETSLSIQNLEHSRGRT